MSAVSASILRDVGAPQFVIHLGKISDFFDIKKSPRKGFLNRLYFQLYYLKYAPSA